MTKRLKKNKGIKDIIIFRCLYLLTGIIISLPALALDLDSIIVTTVYSSKSPKDDLYRNGVRVHRNIISADSLAKISPAYQNTSMHLDSFLINDPLLIPTTEIHNSDSIRTIAFLPNQAQENSTLLPEIEVAAPIKKNGPIVATDDHCLHGGCPSPYDGIINSSLKKDISPAVPLKTNNTITASIGSANMYDTYLSPLKYKGFSIHLMYEQMRRTTWFDYKFYKQQIFELDLAKGDNPAKNVSEYWALFNYRIGGHYTVYNTDKLRVGIGGLWDINAGVLYNERNGNNPASARAYSNLNISATASYKFNKFAIRWQIDSPFMGILFSPKYGQSYYEISLGNSVGLVNFASFHNQRALRNYVTADVPLGQYIIRVGYMGSFYQTKVHDIQTHHYTNSFVIGFPIEGIKKLRQKTMNQYWDGH